MRFICGLLLLAALLVGCGGGANLEKAVVGTWKVDTAKTKIESPDIKSEADRKQMMSVLGTGTLELKEDKTFILTLIFPLNGTWALEGSKLTLTPTLKEGESFALADNSKTLPFDVDSGGTSMSMTIKSDKGTGTLAWMKEAAK